MTAHTTIRVGMAIASTGIFWWTVTGSAAASAMTCAGGIFVTIGLVADPAPGRRSR